MVDCSDWRLNSAIFKKIEQIWSPIEVDLFNSRLNSVLSLLKFVARSLCSSHRCLSTSMDQLEKFSKSAMEVQQAQLILIIPVWKM